MPYIKYNITTYEVLEYAPQNKDGISNYNSPANANMLKEDGYENLDVVVGFDEKEYVKGYAPEKPLELVKEEKLIELKNKRDEVEQEYFRFKSVKYDGDVISIMRLNLAAEIAKRNIEDPEYRQMWVDYDNNYQVLTAQDMQDIITAIKDHSQECHNNYGLKKIAVNNAATVEEVESIEW